MLKWEWVLEGSQHRKKEPVSIHVQLHAPYLIHRIEQEKLFLKMFLNALEKSTGNPAVSLMLAVESHVMVSWKQSSELYLVLKKLGKFSVV